MASLPIVQFDPTATLRAHGMPVTAQRIAVLRSVHNAPHATADEVAAATHGSIGSISRQSVYSTLGAFVERGIVRRIQPIGSVARYEDRVDDNHHHVVCRNCGAIADVPCAVGLRPCLSASETHGFVIDEADVSYWGVCPACTRRGDKRSRSTTGKKSIAKKSIAKKSTTRKSTTTTPNKKGK
jgi:Fur family ferric uptake transcriptional regulator